MPRHSPYALFRLNSLLLILHFRKQDQLFFAWASQIIVCLGCKLKDHCSCNSLCVRFNRFLYQSDEIVSRIIFITLTPNYCTEKPFSYLSNKFFSMILFIKRINIQLSVSFLLFYSVFNEHLLTQTSLSSVKSEKWRVKKWNFRKKISGRPKWTRTTDLVLIRHAL